MTSKPKETRKKKTHNSSMGSLYSKWLNVYIPLCRSEKPSAYKIFLGIHTERANEPSKQEREVSKIIKGPAGTDIALLKLDRLEYSVCNTLYVQYTLSYISQFNIQIKE